MVTERTTRKGVWNRIPPIDRLTSVMHDLNRRAQTMPAYDAGIGTCPVVPVAQGLYIRFGIVLCELYDLVEFFIGENCHFHIFWCGIHGAPVQECRHSWGNIGGWFICVFRHVRSNALKQFRPVTIRLSCHRLKCENPIQAVSQHVVQIHHCGTKVRANGSRLCG